MSRRSKVFIGLAAALAVVIGVVWVQMQRAAAFDRDYQALVLDIRQRIDRVGQQRDLTAEFFAWLDTDARSRLEKLPEPPEQFQQILRQRLVSLLDGVTETHRKNPLQAESLAFLNDVAVELESMLASLREATGFQSTH